MFLHPDDFSGLGERLTVLAGGLGVAPQVSSATVARVKAAGAVVAKRRMLERQAAIAKKLGLPASTIGFVPSNGLGHILSTYQAVKEGEGPWYNPGSEHNEKHRTGFWPDLKQYDAALIEKVKKLNGLSQYEVEHMTPALLNPLIAKAKAGERVIAPSPAGPPPTPTEAANAALKESAGGKLILASEKVYDAGAAALQAPLALMEWVSKHKKALIYGGAAVGLGLVALVVWPYISAARAGGRALQKKFGGA